MERTLLLWLFRLFAGRAQIHLGNQGLQTHVQDMDRKRYCEELNRETFLQALGFRVISFAYDDVAHRPELCMTLLHSLCQKVGCSQSAAPQMEKSFSIASLAGFWTIWTSRTGWITCASCTTCTHTPSAPPDNAKIMQIVHLILRLFTFQETTCKSTVNFAILPLL